MPIRREILNLQIAVLAVGAAIVLLAGCSTPPAIRAASKTQCELVSELDQSLQALESGLIQFHQDNQDQIRQVGRILIAKQAINVVMEGNGIPKTTNGTITVDDLFEKSKSSVRPFVDYAFSSSDIENQVKHVTDAMNATTNRVAHALLKAKLDGLKLRIAELAGKPNQVAALEEVLDSEIAKQEETEENVRSTLDITALMEILIQAASNATVAIPATKVMVIKEQIVAINDALGQLTERGALEPLATLLPQQDIQNVSAELQVARAGMQQKKQHKPS